MKNLIYIITTSLIFFSCSKKKDDNFNVPPPPSTSNNSVTALVNDQSWQGINTMNAQISFSLLPGFRIFTFSSFGNNYGIYLGVADSLLSQVEKFDTNAYSYPPAGSRMALFDYALINSTDTVFDTTPLSGWIKITSQDTANNKISGSFDYTIIDTNNGNDTIHVSQGVFENMVYQVYN